MPEKIMQDSSLSNSQKFLAALKGVVGEKSYGEIIGAANNISFSLNPLTNFKNASSNFTQMCAIGQNIIGAAPAFSRRYAAPSTGATIFGAPTAVGVSFAFAPFILGAMFLDAYFAVERKNPNTGITSIVHNPGLEGIANFMTGISKKLFEELVENPTKHTREEFLPVFFGICTEQISSFKDQEKSLSLDRENFKRLLAELIPASGPHPSSAAAAFSNQPTFQQS